MAADDGPHNPGRLFSLHAEPQGPRRAVHSEGHFEGQIRVRDRQSLFVNAGSCSRFACSNALPVAQQPLGFDS
jgi:hypothetical protein